jgi:prophage regulatory protein
MKADRKDRRRGGRKASGEELSSYRKMERGGRAASEAAVPSTACAEMEAASPRRPPASDKLAHLPVDLARSRILNTAEAAAFCGHSIAQWRRLYRLGQIPRPRRLSVRKYGWRLGDLIDHNAALSQTA